MGNKYLEKIAGVNRFINSAIRIADDLSGHSARQTKAEAAILARAQALGRTAKGSAQRANALQRRSTRTRIKAGVGGAVVLTGGFLGLHKYHQHKDKQILDRINSMYVDPNQQNK